MERKLPGAVKKIIKDYFALNIGRKKVVTPYYRNVKRIRAELRSLIGKGTPEEIEEETLIYAKLRGFNFRKNSEKEIREFMRSQGIGIDCSGFAVHLYDTWLKALKKGSLFQNLKFPKASLYRQFVRLLRPIENISADLLTNNANSEKIELKKVQIGDMIRLKGLKRGHHIAVIIEIEKFKSGKIKKIKYVHSSPRYGENNGVRYGEIKIEAIKKELKDQVWLEKDENGICWTYRELLKDYKDNGLRRPNFFINQEDDKV